MAKKSLGIAGSFLRFAGNTVRAFFHMLEHHPIEGVAFALLNSTLAFFSNSFSRFISLELSLYYLVGVLIYHAIMPVLRPIWDKKQKSVFMEYFSAISFVTLMIFYAYLIVYLLVFDILFLIETATAILTG